VCRRYHALVHASPHRLSAARRVAPASFSPSHILSFPLSSCTNQIIRSCYRGRPIRALVRPGSDGKGKTEVTLRERWRTAAELVARIIRYIFFFFFSSEEQRTRSGRPPIDKSRKDDGPVRCFRQREVRPCALISNGFTEGPAADDATTVGQYCRFPDPFALLPPRIHYRDSRFLSRHFIKEHTAPSLPPFSPVRPFRLYWNPLPSPSHRSVQTRQTIVDSRTREPRLIRFLGTAVLQFEQTNISF